MQITGYGFLGVDVSKGMSNFILQDAQGLELESNFQLDDNVQGHKTLYHLIEKWKVGHDLKKIVVGLESTGGYENNWYKGLRSRSKSLGLEVFRINPKRIYHEGKTEGRRSITDGVSAQIIAGYMRKNYGKKDMELKRLEQTNEEYVGMRTLHRYIQKLTRQNTRTKNSLGKLLYSSMPEILTLKGDQYSNWFVELLVRYPSRALILEAGIQGLMEISHVGQSKANEIYNLVEESVSSLNDPNINIAISEYAEDIQHTTKKINRLKKQLAITARKEKKTEEDIEIVNSINGLADYSTIGILLEIGSISRFDKGGNLVAFFGINPTVKQSGDKSYRIGMSKDGSPNARAILFTAAENVVNYEPYFQAIYQKYILQGKKHRFAIGAVMSKLTRVIFGMLKNRTKFDPGVDTLNQLKKKKVVAKKEAPKDNKERRYQKQEDIAPISMRQKKKRKQEQLVSS